MANLVSNNMRQRIFYLWMDRICYRPRLRLRLHLRRGRRTSYRCILMMILMILMILMIPYEWYYKWPGHLIAFVASYFVCVCAIFPLKWSIMFWEKKKWRKCTIMECGWCNTFYSRSASAVHIAINIANTMVTHNNLDIIYWFFNYWFFLKFSELALVIPIWSAVRANRSNWNWMMQIEQNIPFIYNFYFNAKNISLIWSVLHALQNAMMYCYLCNLNY